MNIIINELITYKTKMHTKKYFSSDFVIQKAYKERYGHIKLRSFVSPGRKNMNEFKTDA